MTTYYIPWAYVVKGVLDSQGDQVYPPNYKDFPSSTKQNFIEQSNQVRDLYLTYDGLNLYQAPFDGKLIDAQLRADVGNPSCSWRSSDTRSGCKVGNSDVTGYDYLPKVNNPHHTGRI